MVKKVKKRNKLSEAQKVFAIFKVLEGDLGKIIPRNVLFNMAHRLLYRVRKPKLDPSFKEPVNRASYHNQNTYKMMSESPFYPACKEPEQLRGFMEDDGYNQRDYSPRIKKGNEFI